MYKIWVNPEDLWYIDIIEQVAYQSQEQEVVEKSIGLFVNCYLAICDEDDAKRCKKENDDKIFKMKKLSYS